MDRCIDGAGILEFASSAFIIGVEIIVVGDEWSTFGVVGQEYGCIFLCCSGGMMIDGLCDDGSHMSKIYVTRDADRSLTSDESLFGKGNDRRSNHGQIGNHETLFIESSDSGDSGADVFYDS